MAVFHRRRVVFHEMYLLPEPIFGTKKHRSESFGSYIWLQVSIKVVTLFIHVNRHPVASHMNNTRTHTLATRTKTFLMQSERKQKCCWCGMRNVWMKWILMCVCVKHTTILVLQKKTVVRMWDVHLRIDDVKDIYSHWNVCGVCQSHASKYWKLDVQIMFESVIFPLEIDTNWIRLNQMQWTQDFIRTVDYQSLWNGRVVSGFIQTNIGISWFYICFWSPTVCEALERPSTEIQ